MSRSGPTAIRRALVGLAAAALVAMGMSIPATALASEPTNMVLVWNENAVSVISSAPTATPPGLGQAPPPSVVSLAIVHGAIYDAVNAIDKGHQPYLAGLSAPSTASKAAAVAQAAHNVLVGLVPATPPALTARADALLASSLALIDPGQAKTDGIAIGAAAAAAMLAARANDGRFDSEPWPVGTDPGEWRPVAPLSLNVFGQFATVKPFALNRPDQYRTEGMPALSSPAYAADFNEIKALGAQSGSSRTPEQTALAAFMTANPLIFMNKGLRDIAVARGLSTTQQALLFAKTSMGSADGLIGCSANKARWLNWRPQTAIREAANDGNPATAPDANWLSLFATPGYPDNPSGYNCYTAGLWYSARLFFGTDRISFQLTSPGVPANPAAGNPVGVAGGTRNYVRLTNVVDDTIEGRMLNGFHFRTTDEQGAWLGKKAAQWLDKHFFAPVD